MDLLSLAARFNTKKEPPKNYVALKISLQNLTAAVWKIEGGKVKIEKTQTSSLDDLKDLLPAADKLISEIADSLIPKPKDIFFGVLPDWIAEGKISENYLSSLKKLCQKLGFLPMGFVAIPDAVANYLKEIETAPLTAILVGIDLNKVFATIVRAGKNLGTQTAEITPTENINVLLEKALKNFPEAEILPSRIIIYNGQTNLEKIREQILSHPWAQKLPFLHFPKVEILDTAVIIKAVAFAGGTAEPVQNVQPVSPADLGFRREETAETPEPPALPKTFKLPPLPHFNLLFLLAPLFFILASFLAFFIYLNFFTTAKIVLYVAPKILEKDQSVEVVTNKEIKPGEPKILGEIIEEFLSGSKRTVTTGKKLVGTKTKGTITLYATTVGRTFPAGTVLAGVNNLKFNLDGSLTVASGSAASPASVLGNVTATGIGESYNLAAGSLLSLADYPSSSYQAKNDSAFSGGTSRQAQVVIAKDEDRLVATLSAELLTKAIDNLRGRLQPGQNLLDKAVTSTIIEKKFDRNLDDEADSIGLNLTMRFAGVIFAKEKLTELFGRLISDSIPADFVFDPQQSTIEVKSTTVDKNSRTFLNTSFQAKLLPKIDRDKIIDSARRKSLPDAAILISPTIFNRWQVIPRNPKNITLDIVAK